MKYIFFSKSILVLVSLLFLHLTIVIASDQRPAADAEVTFEVA